jgi:hypothetical protein
MKGFASFVFWRVHARSVDSFANCGASLLRVFGP